MSSLQPYMVGSPFPVPVDIIITAAALLPLPVPCWLVDLLISIIELGSSIIFVESQFPVLVDINRTVHVKQQLLYFLRQFLVG